jgi:hypothetical protein
VGEGEGVASGVGVSAAAHPKTTARIREVAREKQTLKQEALAI